MPSAMATWLVGYTSAPSGNRSNRSPVASSTAYMLVSDMKNTTPLAIEGLRIGE